MDEIDKRQVIKQAAIDAGFAFDPRDGNFYGEEGWIGGKLLKMGELLFSRLETEFTARIVAQERIRELETALLGVKEYREKNPLGGPAKVFDAMADAIRAGDDFNAVCSDYGWCPVERAKAAEARAEAMAEELHSWERTFCSSGEFSPALRDYRAAHPKEGA